jgi:hypothetical protein
LDRNNNQKCHSLDNVRLACCECNRIRANNDAGESKVKIRIRNYALENNLQMNLTNKETIQHLEKAKYGGLSKRFASCKHRWGNKD